MSDKKRSIDWKPILLEALFVVLGVVLALGANEWREAQGRKAHAQQALEGIREELENNRAEVATSLTYHMYLSDTLSTLIRGPGGASIVPDGRVFYKGYVNPTNPLSTAWEVALTTDALAEVPYAEALRLSRIYDTQREYERQAHIIGENIYATLFQEGGTGIYRRYQNLALIIGTFIYRECGLLDGYNQILAGEPDGRPAAEPAPLPPLCNRFISN